MSPLYMDTVYVGIYNNIFKNVQFHGLALKKKNLQINSEV